MPYLSLVANSTSRSGHNPHRKSPPSLRILLHSVRVTDHSDRIDTVVRSVVRHLVRRQLLTTLQYIFISIYVLITGQEKTPIQTPPQPVAFAKAYFKKPRAKEYPEISAICQCVCCWLPFNERDFSKMWEREMSHHHIIVNIKCSIDWKPPLYIRSLVVCKCHQEWFFLTK